MSSTSQLSIKLKPGFYVLAISGGVDSMTLLNLLSRDPNTRLIIAHFNHGIRQDSDMDRKLVQETAGKLGLVFVFDKGNLGEDASEEVARNARYKFLYKIKDMVNADAIITAHHQDDLLETIILNLIRGTGRKGLSSIKNEEDLLRPLLAYSKQQIIGYAKKSKIKWREDNTNSNTDLTRNYIRTNIIPKIPEKEKKELLNISKKSKNTNQQLDVLIKDLLEQSSQQNQLDKQVFISLPHTVAKELLIAWLKDNKVKKLDKKNIEKLSVAIKTLKENKQLDVGNNYLMQITKTHVILKTKKQK